MTYSKKSTPMLDISIQESLHVSRQFNIKPTGKYASIILSLHFSIILLSTVHVSEIISIYISTSFPSLCEGFEVAMWGRGHLYHFLLS